MYTCTLISFVDFAVITELSSAKASAMLVCIQYLSSTPHTPWMYYVRPYIWPGVRLIIHNEKYYNLVGIGWLTLVVPDAWDFVQVKIFRVREGCNTVYLRGALCVIRCGPLTVVPPQ